MNPKKLWTKNCNSFRNSAEIFIKKHDNLLPWLKCQDSVSRSLSSAHVMVRECQSHDSHVMVAPPTFI